MFQFIAWMLPMYLITCVEECRGLPAYLGSPWLKSLKCGFMFIEPVQVLRCIAFLTLRVMNSRTYLCFSRRLSYKQTIQITQ